MSFRERVHIDTFTAAGAAVWTKKAAAQMVLIQLLAGGGAGQPGIVLAPGARARSFGGGGGGCAEMWLPASFLGLTENVVVGAGGTPLGTTEGGASSFGTWCFAFGGNGNLGVLNPGGSGFPSFVVAGGVSIQPNVGNNGSDGINTSAPVTSLRGGGAGGAGGGFVSSVALSQGFAGGAVGRETSAFNPDVVPIGLNSIIAGGLLGAPNGGNGNTKGIGFPWGASGGGGGLSAIAANGGNGGNGAQPGGGGGGGASAFTGFTAGLGGNGGNGMIIVTQFF